MSDDNFAAGIHVMVRDTQTPGIIDAVDGDIVTVNGMGEMGAQLGKFSKEDLEIVPGAKPRRES